MTIVIKSVPVVVVFYEFMSVLIYELYVDNVWIFSAVFSLWFIANPTLTSFYKGPVKLIKSSCMFLIGILLSSSIHKRDIVEFINHIVYYIIDKSSIKAFTWVL